MGELSIKIKIANRVYPLTVNADEEEGIRNAAEKINQSVSEFERLYDVKDKQDLIAMAALKLVTVLVEARAKNILKWYAFPKMEAYGWEDTHTVLTQVTK